MATGDISETKTPRFEDNQRWDESDAQAESQLRILREQMFTKAFAGGGLPFLSGFGETIGLVLQGGSIAGQSIGNNLVTLGAELFAAIDADGLLIIKSAASGTISVSCPVGTSTVYAYGVDTPDDLAQRAFIPTRAPFVEFFRGTDTRFTNRGGLIAISGDSTVNSTTINGVTRPLVAVALVSNSGGNTTIVKQYTNVLHSVRPLSLQLTSSSNFNITVTSTGGATSWTYVVVARGRKGQVLKVSQPFVMATGPATLNNTGTSQNNISWTPLPEAQDYLIYRIASGGTPGTTGLITPNPIVLPPGYTASVTFADTGFAGDGASTPISTPSPEVMPLSGTDRGAGGSTSLSLSGFLRTLATLLADVKFKRSAPGTQTNPQLATGNYGLYGTVRRGLDAVDRSTNNVWTVGDGVNTFGDFDLANYANFNALLADLFLAISAVSQVPLSGGRTSLNDKFTVLLKPGTYQLTADITTPANIVFKADGSTAITVTQTGSIGGFSVNTSGRTCLFLSTHILTMADGCEMYNLLVQGGNGGRILLNGHNKVENCTFWQQYALGVVPGGDPVLLSNTVSPPAGGTSDLQIRKCRFFCFNNGGNTLPNTSSNTQTSGIYMLSARDVIIEDCLFATDTQFTGASSTQKPVASTQITIDANVENTIVRRCRFDMYDDLYSGGSDIVQTAVFITCGVALEANKSIKFYDCDFALRNWRTNNEAAAPTLGTCDYRAFQVNEEINVIIDSCQFTSLTDGIIFFTSAVTTHTYQYRSTAVRRCGFNTIKRNGVWVDSAGFANISIRGMEFSDNVFVGGNQFGYGLQFGNSLTADPLRFELVNIDGNKFLDGLGICIGGTLRGTQSFVITNNLVESNASYFVNFASISPNTLVDITISDNSVRNLTATGTAILMNTTGPTGGFEQITVQNNNFSFLFGSVTFATGSEHGVIISGAQLAEVDISGNTFTACGVALTGGARPYFIGLIGGTSTSGDVIANINVQDNNLGDSGSRYEGVLITKGFPGAAAAWSRNISVHNNNFATTYATGTIAQGVTWHLGDTGVGDKWANVNFSHNRTYYEAPSAVTFANDSFQLQLNTVACLEFIGNSWFGNSGSWGSGKGALLAAAGGIATSTKSVGNTASNSAAGATGFTYFSASYSAGNSST